MISNKKILKGERERMRVKMNGDEEIYIEGIKV